MGLGKGPSKLSNMAQLWVSMFKFSGGILHFKISGCAFLVKTHQKTSCMHLIHMIFLQNEIPCKNPHILTRGKGVKPPLISSALAWLPTRGRYLAPAESLPSPSLHLAPLKGFFYPRSQGKNSGKTPRKNRRAK